MKLKPDNIQRVRDYLNSQRNRTLDINTIAKETGVTWWAVYRIVTGDILTELQRTHAEVLKEHSLSPEFTAKGLLVRPQLAQEVA